MLNVAFKSRVLRSLPLQLGNPQFIHHFVSCRYCYPRQRNGRCSDCPRWSVAPLNSCKLHRKYIDGKKKLKMLKWTRRDGENLFVLLEIHLKLSGRYKRAKVLFVLTMKLFLTEFILTRVDCIKCLAASDCTKLLQNVRLQLLLIYFKVCLFFLHTLF